VTLVGWVQDEVDAGGWIRRMFSEGERLRALHGDDAVADLSIGQPLRPGEAVHQAFAQAAADRRPGRFAYMPNSGLRELRERCAQTLGPDAAAESVTITPGAAGAICLALHTFVREGSQLLCASPYFPEFPLYARTNGCKFTSVPSLPGGGLDIEGFAAAMTADTSAVLVNSPCNPSGHVVTDDEWRALSKLLQSQKRPPLLIVDEVYVQFHYAPSVRANPFEHYENCVLVRSFSKDVGIAGERLGYLALHPSITNPATARGLDTCMRALGYVNAPATAQLAMTNLESWNIDLAPYARRRDLLVSGLRDAGAEVLDPGGAIYAWIRSPWDDTLAFVDELAQKRVLVTPGIAFGAPGYMRACFSATPGAIEMAVQAFAELAHSRGKGGIRTPGGA
jgi:aspartate aminotransferase